MVFDVAKMAGWLRPPARAVHVAFGNVLGPDRKMLKSRSGEPVRFVDVVDEAVERATASVKEKNPDLPDDEQIEIGRMVGIGALKYADLSTDRVKDYVFDWDRMLAFEGNTAPYLQYAHARIRSILRKVPASRRPPPEWNRRWCPGARARPPAAAVRPAVHGHSRSTARIDSPRTSSTWPRTSRRSTKRAPC
jgi:arginyl-tRNA synthetase